MSRRLIVWVAVAAGCTGGSSEASEQWGTTLPVDATDSDFDGVPDGSDCAPNDPSIYPGAYDAPGDGIDADCDRVDPPHAWRGTWEVVDVQAIYSTYAILLPGGSTSQLSIADDGEAIFEASALLDPALTGLSLDVFADIAHTGTAAPLARPDQLMLYLEGEVAIPGLLETSYADLLCTQEADTLDCAGTLKALDITLETYVTLGRSAAD